MIVYRIVAQKYADKLAASGRAGRWNMQEEYVIYTSSSRSLATLELLVNSAGIHSGIAYKVMVIDIPDPHEKILVENLPQEWRGLQMYPVLQNLGSKWYQRREWLILQVPSAVIPQENNFIINTLHADYGRLVKSIAIEDYFWDERI